MLLAAAVIALQFSCGKDEQETQKFDRADVENFQRDMSEMSSVALSNGITLYMQEERTDNQVAIEVLYRVGHADDPKGLPQMAHLSEHLAVHCGSRQFQAEEGLKLVNEDRGMLNAEAVADFSHFDYVVKTHRLDQALAVEADRLREMRCDQETLEREAEKSFGEIEKTLADPKGSLARFALMTLTQVIFHGETRVATGGALRRVTIEQAHAFHRAHYRPDDMVIVMIGNFKKAEAEAQVRKHFEGIPRRPAPPALPVTLKRSTRVTWDIDGSAMYFLATEPVATPREAMILSMFGAYFQQVLNQSQDVYSVAQVVQCSNQVYRVGRIPFFIYLQPKQGYTTGDVAPVVLARLDQTLEALDDRRVESIKQGMVSFVTSTMLKPNVPDYPLMHHQVIGQEALNVGIKHYLREGRSVEEFNADIQSITPDEVRATVGKHLARQALIEVQLAPGR